MVDISHLDAPILPPLSDREAWMQEIVDTLVCRKLMQVNQATCCRVFLRQPVMLYDARRGVLMWVSAKLHNLSSSVACSPSFNSLTSFLFLCCRLA